MTMETDKAECTKRCWQLAAVAGAVLFLVLWLVTSTSFLMSLFLGIVVFVGVGLGLIWLWCSDETAGVAASPAPKPAPKPEAGPTPAKPEPTPPGKAATETADPAPVATPMAAAVTSLVKPSTPLPGQAELAARKGSWTYQGGAASPAKPSPVAGDSAAPATLDAARPGGADDLKLIKGVGPKLEKLLNSMGFYHFDQVAGWSEAEVAWVDENLEGFKGRVSRDGWVEQAKTLAAGGDTEFSKRSKS